MPPSRSLRTYLGVFRYTVRAAELVWQTHRGLTIALGVLTLTGGLLPAGIAWLGKLIIDGVVTAAETGLVADRDQALRMVAAEGGLVALLAGVRRGIEVCNSLLRALLGHRVNVMILEKALELDLEQFEDSEFYDRMTRARREASSRPLSLVKRTFGLVQNAISLVTYGALLLGFSPWAVLVLGVASIPAFIVETRYASVGFRLFRWQSPEKRKQSYLEMVVAREDFAKEVMLYGLGPSLVGRYRSIFERMYGDDRDLTLRRGTAAYALGLLSIGALYGAYAWIAVSAVARAITLGDMTMYLMVFRQGQGAFSQILYAIGGMYEDNLYLSNLYEFLEQPVPERGGAATTGPDPADGIRFEGVYFTYPGADSPALKGIDLHIPPGSRLALVGHNGSGKTTLVKLLTRLYEPSSGRMTLDGRSLAEWDLDTLRRRIGVIFQDFARYQFTVGENIGVGDVERLTDRERQIAAAQKGMAAPFIADVPGGYDAQLGRWFKGGRELSIGQWQKVALSRAFMRAEADVLVLDEPTAAMDAEAEAEIYQRLADLTDTQIAILISHRFSTVRMADEIVVLDGGEVVEQGDHAALMALNGRYAGLFTLQAAGYR